MPAIFVIAYIQDFQLCCDTIKDPSAQNGQAGEVAAQNDAQASKPGRQESVSSFQAII